MWLYLAIMGNGTCTDAVALELFISTPDPCCLFSIAEK